MGKWRAGSPSRSRSPAPKTSCLRRWSPSLDSSSDESEQEVSIAPKSLWSYNLNSCFLFVSQIQFTLVALCVCVSGNLALAQILHCQTWALWGLRPRMLNQNMRENMLLMAKIQRGSAQFWKHRLPAGANAIASQGLNLEDCLYQNSSERFILNQGVGRMSGARCSSRSVFFFGVYRNQGKTLFFGHCKAMAWREMAVGVMKMMSMNQVGAAAVIMCNITSSGT